MYHLKTILEKWQVRKPDSVDDCMKDVILMIANLTNLNFHPKKLDDVIPFGKHKGKTVLQIIDLAPTYFTWCIENMDGFMLDEESFNYMVSKEKK